MVEASGCAARLLRELACTARTWTVMAVGLSSCWSHDERMRRDDLLAANGGVKHCCLMSEFQYRATSRAPVSGLLTTLIEPIFQPN